jgi:hypothetical protein
VPLHSLLSPVGGVTFRSYTQKYFVCTTCQDYFVEGESDHVQEEHRRIIKRIGRAKLVELTKLTPEAIHWWEKTGIPRAWRGSVEQWAAQA